ncbi:MAG: hypothetical protein GX025_10075 [Clostridiales bacterium]|nr:hypothetical protein [Clostridiales bacterium]
MGAVSKILEALQIVLPDFANSDGSIENKIIDTVGSYADSETVERNNTLATINAALANQKVTNKTYYRRKAVAFQLGDMLIYDSINQGAYYATIDPGKQLVKQAYVTGSYPLYTLFVNAIGADGHLRKLTTGELDAFRTYFEAFQPIGLKISITSMDVANITDPGILIYVRAGADAGMVATEINANLLAYESVFRENNKVALTEILDVIQQQPDVVAVGFNDPIASEMQLSGEIRATRPVEGLFDLVNGAFIFATEITASHIKVMQ